MGNVSGMGPAPSLDDAEKPLETGEQVRNDYI
jgi:hypothetical protein